MVGILNIIAPYIIFDYISQHTKKRKTTFFDFFFLCAL